MLGKQAADLCTSTLTQYFVREFFADGQLARLRRRRCATIYRARRDAMLDALERYFPPSAELVAPEGGLFCWATLPAYIDTTDLLAKALRENVAFVPGAAAYVDGRGGSVDAAQLLGLRRGRDHARASNGSARWSPQQVELYEAITGDHQILTFRRPGAMRPVIRRSPGFASGDGRVRPRDGSADVVRVRRRREP